MSHFINVLFVCSSHEFLCVHQNFLLNTWLDVLIIVHVYFNFFLTLEGLKLAAATGPPRTVNTANQRPPRRRKNDPGPNSPHEYKTPSFRDEYSFTYYTVSESGVSKHKIKHETIFSEQS